MDKILKKLVDGEISIEKCETLLKSKSIQEMGEIAKFDCSRKFRLGFPEAVLAESKSFNDLISIIQKYFTDENENINLNKDNLIITRLSKERFELLKENLSYFTEFGIKFEYNVEGRILVIYSNKLKEFDKNLGKIGILTAGTSDISVAEEAKVIIEQGGCEVINSYDIGISGIHRLFPQIAKMIEEEVNVIIVCAGMEGALPSVVAGLVDVPVIGVPTSVGYGVGADGKAALYSMLQSCAPGLSVVNIDNGFGAGVCALTISKRISKKK